MKPLFKMNHLLILLFACEIYFACTKDEAVTENPSPPTPTAQNLITNGSFEISGHPSLQGWYYVWDSSYSSLPLTPLDTVVQKFAQDAPTGGGNWSLEIRESLGGGGCATFITNQSATNIYQLTFWAKGIMVIQGLPRQVCMELLSPLWPYSGNEKCINLDTVTQWKQYTLTDTLTTVPNDTITIFFYIIGCGGPSLCPPKYRFDLIELKKTSI